MQTSAPADLVAPAAAGTGAVGYTATANFITLRYIRIINQSSISKTASLWKGATGASAAGTEILIDFTLNPGDVWEWRGAMRLEGTNGFLVGRSVVALGLGVTFLATGEVGVV